MDNVACYARHGEVSDNADHEKYQVGCIRSTEECVTILENLLNVHAEHVLLNFTDDATKNVRYR